MTEPKTDELLQASAATRQLGASSLRTLETSQMATEMLPVAAPSGRASQFLQAEAQPPSPEAAPQQPVPPHDQYMALCLAVKDEVRHQRLAGLLKAPPFFFSGFSCEKRLS